MFGELGKNPSLIWGSDFFQIIIIIITFKN